MNISQTTNENITTDWAQPIWVQQSFESRESFEAFYCFMTLPSNYRNMAEVARYCSIPREQVFTLSQSHHWKARIDSYDEFVSNSNRDLLRQSNQDRAGRHLALLDKAMEVANREFNNLLERMRQLDAQGAGVSLMKPTELQSLVRDMIKLERLIIGEVTERSEELYDLSKLTLPELTTWKKLIAKVKSKL